MDSGALAVVRLLTDAPARAKVELSVDRDEVAEGGGSIHNRLSSHTQKQEV
jgi:hypothetical protein